MSIPLLAHSAPQPPASAASPSAPGHPSAAGGGLGLSRIQGLAIVAIFLCVAATVAAVITEMSLYKARYPIAGISLVCAFMSVASLPDWRGKAGFVVFMVFTACVALKEDPTTKQPAPYLDDVQAPPRSSRQSTRTGGRLGEAAVAHLRLGSPTEVPDGRSGGLHAAAPKPRRVAATEPVSLRLDSIRAINDGSPGTSDWRFDVYVNRHLELPLGLRTYQDSPRRRTKTVARETRFVPAAPPPNSLTVQVQGIRSALFGNYVASGRSDPVPLAELAHGQSKQVIVPVRADEGHHGDFSFFFTIRRP